MPFKILIIDVLHHSFEELFAAPDLDLQIDYKPYLSPAEAENMLKMYDGLVLRSKLKLTERVLQKAPQLRLIARAGAGLDEIDLSYLAARNIKLLHAPEGNRDAVAEHTIGLMLALLHKIVAADKQVRQYLWQREANRGIELGSQTVGIIGYGNMGQTLARKLSGFGTKVLAFDKNEAAFTSQSLQWAQAVDFPTLQAKADIVSLHFPLDERNKNSVNAAYLAGFRKPIFLINTARGEILNTQALLNALELGKVAGAALDVLENEQLERLTPAQKKSYQALFERPDVILTPHVAGWTHQSYRRINEVLALKIKAYLKEEKEKRS
ncbi:NAD(P)-dependent oxidoreductase [Hugenholtzia roseola]|uniref:NAD(P)-dependent oxidoreductase n=1 Tax=Hugenholtzia roseola TaxID=1002 RepID=UPI0003F5547C|nr:NAD(P)-dependent oxidoreductase [Hugenholtzia roseola]